MSGRTGSAPYDCAGRLEPSGTAENAWNDALQHIEEGLSRMPSAAQEESADEIERLRSALDDAEDRADLYANSRPVTADAAQAARMTYDTIEKAFADYQKTLTVMDTQPSFDSFSQGYVAGWNAKEAAIVPAVAAESSAPEDRPGLLDTNPELFNILNSALGTMHYHRLISALNWNDYQILRDVPQASPTPITNPLVLPAGIKPGYYTAEPDMERTINEKS